MCYFMDRTVATSFAVKLLIVHFVGPEGATRRVQYKKGKLLNFFCFMTEAWHNFKILANSENVEEHTQKQFHNFVLIPCRVQ